MKNTAGQFLRNRTTRRDAQARVARAPLGLTAADLLKLVLLLALAAALSGCGMIGKMGKGVRQQAVTFEGVAFRGDAKPMGDKGGADFTATVRQPARSIDGAVQAAQYQGTKYCIENFGTSDIDWTVGPDTPKDQLAISNDTLSLSGRCRDQ